MLSAERGRELRAFCRSAGLRFRNLTLLHLSLTHRSVSNESAGERANNERLEFLGDAVLGAVTAALLYGRFPEKSEGELAKIKSVVVSEEILSGIALELGLDGVLVLGKGEEQTGGRGKKAILADAAEALIGALYLDSGFKAASDFTARRINAEIDRVLSNPVSRDYKSLLQEYCQRLYKICPAYRLVKRTGPEHERLFWMEVSVRDQTFGPSTGRNKKAAEQEAARLAWEALPQGG